MVGMYYGSYTNETIESYLGSTHFSYQMDFAYLLTLGAYFLLFFLVIAVRYMHSPAPISTP